MNKSLFHTPVLILSPHGMGHVVGENEKELKLSRIAYILCFRVCVSVNVCVLFLMHLNLVETKSSLFKT